MFPTQAYAEAAWEHPDAEPVRAARMGEGGRPNVQENRVSYELYVVPTFQLSHGAKVT